MSREYRLFVEDMRKACQKVIHYTQNLTREEFVADVKTFDATMRNLEIIGEAVKHTPSDVRARYPEIQWRRITSLRDVVIYEYFGVDTEIIWDIVTNKVSELLRQLDRVS